MYSFWDIWSPSPAKGAAGKAAADGDNSRRCCKIRSASVNERNPSFDLPSDPLEEPSFVPN
eukprot:scaffold34601_cov234-Amphora_coffeaeformis.AAC.10